MIRNRPKRTISASGGLGLLYMLVSVEDKLLLKELMFFFTIRYKIFMK